MPSGTHGYEINGIYAGPGAAEQGEERTSLIPEEVETARLVSAVDASQGFNGGVAIDVVSKKIEGQIRKRHNKFKARNIKVASRSKRTRQEAAAM